jgi:hypothetical protein
VLLDSTGVLFRLPMADMLSIVASEVKRVGAGQGNFSRDAKPETELFQNQGLAERQCTWGQATEEPCTLGRLVAGEEY